ncbi:ORF6C domain-containing protein [Clostridium perfringens]|uniref:ORF6C domain-containing protein n=1 Tax=Clostridium perfringens TaxID=1502 RepID=UPI0022477865|nr:ORF6C domain-containing protein [Clostridium perfringens]MCX0373003.1 ORF6C domain-containing protein [Clostridium perfringens]
MNNLVLKEKQEFMGIQIPVIEGGFGEGQKVILAKTVAEIHEVSTPDINKLINRNIERFTINDLLDIKNCQSLSDQQFLSMGFTKMQISKAENIFLLSQRGYTKLVAMMDNSNDKKWDVMNNLIDDYFNMRNQLSSGQALKEISAIDLFEAQVQAFKEVKQQINEVNHKALEAKAKSEKLEERMDNQTLSTDQTKKLKKLANSLAVPLVGGKGSKAYDPMIRKVYKDIYRQLFRELGVNASDEIKVKDFNFALEVMNNYKIATALKNEIAMLNNQS